MSERFVRDRSDKDDPVKGERQEGRKRVADQGGGVEGSSRESRAALIATMHAVWGCCVDSNDACSLGVLR